MFFFVTVFESVTWCHRLFGCRVWFGRAAEVHCIYVLFFSLYPVLPVEMETVVKTETVVTITKTTVSEEYNPFDESDGQTREATTNDAPNIVAVNDDEEQPPVSGADEIPIRSSQEKEYVAVLMK